MADSRHADRTTLIRADAGAANLAVTGDQATMLADGETTEPRRRAADLEVGDRVGRYRIEGQLGAGGMGSVYAAHDPDLDRRVAIKVLHARVDGRSGGSQRLLREAQAMARLTHANVVTVHDVGVLGQRLFVAMELIDGADLKAWLDAGPRSWKEIVAAFVAAGQGLAAAHAAGIIHRDFKPDNVMMAADGRICVGDFGLAAAVRERSTETRAPVEPPTSVLSTAGSLTVPGAIMGTPAYMAPEQMIGAEVTPAADIFSFSVALFEALHGVRPFRGETVATIFLAIRRGEIVATKTKLPRRLDRIVRRGLAADPDERWPSMDAILGELRSVIAPRGRWLALAGVGLSGALAAALLLPDAETVDCSDSGAAVAEVWTAERRAAVEGAFAATELVYAPATAKRVGAAVDGFAAAWSEVRRGVCEERGRGEISDELSDLRVACLDRQLDELERLLTFFEGADKGIVDNALSVARDLPSPDRCDPAEVLAAANQRERSPELDALEAKIADARRLHTAGKYGDAIALLDPVVARLEELEAAELLAEALVVRSHSAYIDGYPDADVRLRRALAAALAVGDDRRFAQAAADQLGLDRADEEARELWLAIGEAAIERVGGYDSARAKLLNNYGNALSGAGALTEAIEVFEEVVRLRRRGDADAPELVADALFNLGSCYVKLDEHARARALISEAVEIWRRELGPQHPRMIIGLQGLTMTSARVADYDGALLASEQALAIAKETLRRGHPRVISILGGLAVVHEYRGDFAASRAVITEARELVEASGEAARPLERSYLLLSLAGLELESGDLEAAQAAITEARARLAEPLPAADLLRFYLDNVDARLAAARGEHDVAAAAFAASEAVVEALGEGSAAVMSTHELTRTELALAAGRIDDGLAFAARIRSDASSEALRHPTNRARLGFMEAQLLAAAGREEEAVAAARDAAAIYAGVGGFYEARRVAIEAWLRDRGAPSP